MQFRKFAAYDKTAAQSLFTVPCTLMKLDGNYMGGGGEFLQIFDKATAAVANDVPIASFTLFGAGPLPSIFETMGAVQLLNGLSIGISTVNEKYTASASSFDIFGGISLMELPQVATSYGPTDLSGVSGYWEVWDTGSPRHLYAIAFTNAAPAATKTWLVVCAESTGGNIFIPLEFIPLFKTANADGTGTVTNISSGFLQYGAGGRLVQGIQQTVDALSLIGPPFVYRSVNGLGLFVTDTANPASINPISLAIRTDATILTAYSLP